MNTRIGHGRLPLPEAEYWRRRRAREAVTLALMQRRLVRPARCEDCGAPYAGKGPSKNICAHHDDYDKKLEVRWLCHACHVKADIVRRQREKERVS